MFDEVHPENILSVLDYPIISAQTNRFIDQRRRQEWRQQFIDCPFFQLF